MRRTVIVCVFLAGLSATFVRAQESGEVAIRRLRQEFVKAVNDRDPEKALACWTDDAVTLVENRKPAVLAELRESLKTMVAGGRRTDFAMETVRVKASGNLAYEVGRYSFARVEPDGSKKPERGKYVDVWERQPGGEWRIVVHAPSSDPQM